MAFDNIIHDQYEVVKNKYPKLKPPSPKSLGWNIDGYLDVIDDEGGYWDTYKVTIFVPEDYPVHLPELIETGKKIERHIDWHNIDGVCCLSTKAVMFHEMRGNITLLFWLDKYALPYLANHVYRVQTGHYANLEFEHGVPGIIQGYSNLFGINDKKFIIERLKLLTGFRTIGRNDPCFCGSGIKYKKCYCIFPESHLMGVPYYLLRDDLNKILGFFKIPQFLSKN
jgi:hypothetical protein